MITDLVNWKTTFHDSYEAIYKPWFIMSISKLFFL